MGKKFTFYPGCSSEGSGVHLDTSTRAVMAKLGFELEDISDWNCCGASVGDLAAGHLPTAALSARNLAQAKEQGDQDVMTACAACYLNTHATNEEIRDNEQSRADLNEALAAAGKSYDGSLHVRHACEVLVNDVGMDAIKAQVSNPLEGLKVAGYIGCQTVRPFAGTERGGDYSEYDHPSFLDDFIKASGAEAVDFENATSCCGGSVAVMKPEQTLHLMHKILSEAKEKQADVIATPCPLCQTNVEMYQDAINKKYGTDFNIPVVFHTQLLAVAMGLDSKKDAALHQNIIPADKLKAMAK
ncbi:MAG: CoB--CoM heterodisulfide reductase iron-sulfur subunit B family protein [Magnetovibrio sp.]|nr:CoB--CoM heterodisulfide reductase iron-sulfur subunit B family protein [Magnetovibrio sp.]